MSETVPFTLQAPTALLHGLVDLPEEPGERPAVVICHGFKGFMEWGFFPALAALLAERGYVAVRFNLSGTGMRPGDELVTDPSAFRANTYSRELAELLAVLDATGESIARGRVDRGRIGLLGHSRGGGDALLAAASPAWRDRLRALVTWAAIADIDRFTPAQKEEWRRSGELPVTNARTGQQLALGAGLLTDIEERAPELDLLAAAAIRRAPGSSSTAPRTRPSRWPRRTALRSMPRAGRSSSSFRAPATPSAAATPSQAPPRSSSRP
jgi:uncharacterized protein